MNNILHFPTTKNDMWVLDEIHRIENTPNGSSYHIYKAYSVDDYEKMITVASNLLGDHFIIYVSEYALVRYKPANVTLKLLCGS
ncbi:hypothetical protein M0R04_11690 [Candidatus Dojkabacteria bacterium]|jgi:hypothetical protein|nr:hypothetical protein [Candidatus Dojkabacteria bacterium]